MKRAQQAFPKLKHVTDQFLSAEEDDSVKHINLKNFVCELCGNECSSKALFLHHMSLCRRKETRKPYTRKCVQRYCQPCKLQFPSAVMLEYHNATVHQCRNCNFEGKKEDVILHTTHTHHLQRGAGKSCEVIYKDIRPFKETNAFKGYVLTYRHTCKTNYPTLMSYLNEIRPFIRKLVRKANFELKAIKCQISVKVTFRRYLCDNEAGKNIYEYQHKYINSNMLVILNLSQFKKFYAKCVSKIENTTNIFEQYGSGWQLDCVTGCDVRIGLFRPFKGSCWINIPPVLKNKKCIVNIKNNDNMCFKWAVLSALHKPFYPSEKVNEVKSYSVFEGLYDFSCVKFPVKVTDIPSFENKNKIAINVFSWEYKEGLIPVHKSELNYTKCKTIDLLLLYHPAAEHQHYASVRDINKLLGKNNHHRRLLCYNCMQLFPKCKKTCKVAACVGNCVLNEHLVYCQQFKFQKVKCPKLDDEGKPPVIKFTNVHRQLKCGYVIYADFESILIPWSENIQASLKKRKKKRRKRRRISYSKTEKTSFHSTSGFCYVVIKQDGRVITYRVYRGPNAVEIFLTDIFRITELILKIYSIHVKIKISQEQEDAFQLATHCHICDLSFDGDDVKCRDHCHLTGEYRGAAHSDPCNLNYTQDTKVPVITHNFRGYDSHFIVKGFGKFGKYFNVIPTNSEKYLSVTVDSIMFIDSLQFLNSALATLVENLNIEDEKRNNFDILYQVFDDASVELLSKRKGVYPYDYMDSWDRFEETSLPPISSFYNKLRNENISQDDYDHAKLIFNHFEMDNLGDYHDLYLLADTLQLSCVFENFRDLSLKKFKLDPVYYMSAPGLSWDAALRMTGVELEQITDINIHEFLELGIRGGISMITHRRAEATNKYMSNYDGLEADENQKYLLYLDMVNLYGIAMQQSLPVSGFRWLNSEEIEKLDIQNITDSDDDGYIFECDLFYPSSIHDAHNDYPLAPERITIPTSRFGEYQTNLLQNLGIKYMENQTKLIPHLGNRDNYIIHARNLKYYLEKGMQLKRISKVLTFKQRPWLEPYITFNTTQRMHCKNDFEQALYKLLNNAIYGKGMENVRKRISIKLVNDGNKAKWLMAKPQYMSHDILAPNLCSFRMQKATAKLDKPIYTGFAVLELSKLYMYQFHYNFTKVIFGDRAKLLMTDTDSLAYVIRSEDVYEELQPHSHLFDMSKYPQTHPLYSPLNKMVLGKMKDEANGNILYKFVGLGPKSYCFVGSDNSNSSNFEKKAIKGIPKYIQKRSLNYELLDTILKEQDILVCRMNQLRSYKHKMYSISIRKSAVHGFDSKRYICDDGVSTLAWGHYAIPK